jgi:hypothetical protein
MQDANDTAANRGDCDIYVRRNALPTHLSYDWRDISMGTNVRKEFTNAAPGVYYIGVFGFYRCSFTVKATVLGSCPGGCNGHGDCVNGACFCYAGYSGEACQDQDTALTLNGAEIEGTVTQYQWAYYHVRLLNPSPTLVFHVKQVQTGAGFDVDAFVKFNSAPSVFDFDYANATVNPDTMIRIADAKPGFWYLGVMGFACPQNQPCRFKVRVESETSGGQCASRCSKHGTCVGVNQCQCQAGYRGQYCEEKIAPLALTESVDGFVSDQAWNYYSFVSNTMNPLHVKVKQTGATGGDCDVFIRSNAKPTRFEYEYQDIGLDREFVVEILQPGTATWWIGVFGFTPCEYSLQVALPDNPTGGCQHGGTRPDPTGPCQCPAGWTGDNCEASLAVLAAPYRADGRVGLNGWKYYSFTVDHPTSNIFIHLQETGDSDAAGELWLFASRGSAPTIRNHEYADNKHNTKNHILNIQTNPEARTTTLVIGVYGSPFIRRAEATYQLVAWASPF